MRTQSNSALKTSVTDRDVEHILSLRRTFETQRRRLELVETALSEAEGNVIGRIEAGATVMSSHVVTLRASEKRNIQWKSQFVEVAGAQAAERILNSTAPTITIRLLIE
jgi:hypothetical protein